MREQLEGISSIHHSRSQSIGMEFNEEELMSDVIDAVKNMETIKRDQQAQFHKEQLEDKIQMEQDAEEEWIHQRTIQLRRKELDCLQLSKQRQTEELALIQQQMAAQTELWRQYMEINEICQQAQHMQTSFLPTPLILFKIPSPFVRPEPIQMEPVCPICTFEVSLEAERKMFHQWLLHPQQKVFYDIQWVRKFQFSRRLSENTASQLPIYRMRWNSMICLPKHFDNWKKLLRKWQVLAKDTY